MNFLEGINSGQNHGKMTSGVQGVQQVYKNFVHLILQKKPDIINNLFNKAEEIELRLHQS